MQLTLNQTLILNMYIMHNLLHKYITIMYVT